MHINRRNTILLWSFRLGFIFTTEFTGFDRVTPNIFGIKLCTNRRKLWLRLNMWVSGQLGQCSLELGAASVWLENSEVCLPRDKGHCLWFTFLSHQTDVLTILHPSALLYFSVGTELLYQKGSMLLRLLSRPKTASIGLLRASLDNRNNNLRTGKKR